MKTSARAPWCQFLARLPVQGPPELAVFAPLEAVARSLAGLAPWFTLASVIGRTLDSAGTFDAAGYLRVGLSGHQSGLGEAYVPTGSLYLCTTAFLPNGLPASAPFWSDPNSPTSAERAWLGGDLAADSALSS